MKKLLIIIVIIFFLGCADPPVKKEKTWVPIGKARYNQIHPLKGG